MMVAWYDQFGFGTTKKKALFRGLILIDSCRSSRFFDALVVSRLSLAFLTPMDTFQTTFHGTNAFEDAMGCSVVDTHGILKNEKTCRKVKEFANILSIGHQKLACLNAGYSEEHCMSDFSCCLTY
jgi:hypothetical protein